MKYGSMFTGGRLADIGAHQAGLTPIWGIEYDPAIAAVAQQNDPTGTIHAASVLDVDYTTLPRVDVLHASPPCPNFSVAKTGAVETAHDMALADAVCRAITAQRPTLFTLENVRAYKDSKSLARIQATLLDLDYHVTTVIVNAADYGVPQTRVRLFLIAHAGGWMQSQRPLPAKQPWRGWYQAIEDLIPTLPASQFAPWQLARLPGELRETVMFNNHFADPSGINVNTRLHYEPSQTIAPINPHRAFILDCQDGAQAGGLTDRQSTEPMYTMTGSMERRPARAILVESKNSNQQYGDGLRVDKEPSTTVTTDHKPSHQPRAYLATGRVVAMTPRALARFQSVPDDYVLPDKKSLACKIIGNGVAVEAYAALLRSQL
jgi:DNA (cytosine-5)-methyltransferase 1